MKHIGLMIMVAASVWGSRGLAGQAGSAPAADSARVTIEGLVRDISCAVQNPAATARRFNRQCALDCARRGGALAIQTDSGVLYVPISATTPDSSQAPRLMPLVGKYVRVSGVAFERSGLHAIAIARITELPNVPLVTDAH
jgi:hypothetical protein